MTWSHCLGFPVGGKVLFWMRQKRNLRWLCHFTLNSLTTRLFWCGWVLFFCIVLPYPFPGSSFLWNCSITVRSPHFNKMEFPEEGNSIIRKFPITSGLIPQEISSLSTTGWGFQVLYIDEKQLYLLETLKGISQRRQEP